MLSKYSLDQVMVVPPLSQLSIISEVLRDESRNVAIDRFVLHREYLVVRNIKLITEYITNTGLAATRNEEIKSRF
jgi:hypothetical protein